MDCNTLLTKYTRYLLIIFNFLFLLTGIIILSVGVSVKAYFNEFGTILDDKYIYASDLLIIIGVIIFFVAFFGCCGALKENACMTLTFSSLLIVIFVLEVLIGIGGLLLKHKAKDYLEITLEKTLKDYGKVDKNETTALWDGIQTEFKCCGVNNYTDWKNITHNYLPVSCCYASPGAVGNVTCPPSSPNEHLYTTGCLEAFGDYIEEHAVSVETVGIGLALVQLLGILLSCYLSKQLRRGYETV